MGLILWLLITALDIYLWLIIATVIVSWLVAFDVLNTRNKWVYKFCDWLNRLTNPVILRIRKFMPPLGGIDISPIIAMVGISVLQAILRSLM